MAALAMPGLQDAAVSTALASVSIPKGVRLLRVYLDNDWSGDPAIRVVYGVSKKVPLTKARVRDLVQLSRAAADSIDALQTDRIPYISFEDVK